MAAKSRKSTGSSKGSSGSSSSTRSSKGGSFRRSSSSSSKGGTSTRRRSTSYDDRYTSGSSKGGGRSSSRGYGSKGGSQSRDYRDDDYRSDERYPSKGNHRYDDEPVNDPPPYEDADMNFTEEEVYGDNRYSKQGNSGHSKQVRDDEADMTFTEEEVYGDSSEGDHQEEADMTFTEEEVYGDSSNGDDHQEEADMTFTEEEVYGTSSGRGSSRSRRRPETFEVCTPFIENYDEFRETLVRNSPELRRRMISRSNPSHIGVVIDRTPDLRDIHRQYRDAGTRPGQRICLNMRLVRDSRRYVSQIRFTAPDMHTFEDEPVVSDVRQRSTREMRVLRERFRRFANSVIGRVPTYFGRPDSHDITLASALSMYSNNMIRLSRGSRTMIPHDASRRMNRPYVQAAERDWQALGNDPALYRQDTRVINAYRRWTRAVLLEHGNTTDEATINNFVSQFNGYRNY